MKVSNLHFRSSIEIEIFTSIKILLGKTQSPCHGFLVKRRVTRIHWGVIDVIKQPWWISIVLLWHGVKTVTIRDGSRYYNLFRELKNNTRKTVIPLKCAAWPWRNFELCWFIFSCKEQPMMADHLDSGRLQWIVINWYQSTDPLNVHQVHERQITEFIGLSD